MTEMRMKGQMVFEFVIAAIILFTIIIYVINFLSSIMGVYHSRFSGSFLESKAIQISEVLMNDPVEGLSYEWPAFDGERMSDFDAECQDADGYMALIKQLGLVENEPFESQPSLFVACALRSYAQALSDSHHMRIDRNDSVTRDEGQQNVSRLVADTRQLHQD